MLAVHDVPVRSIPPLCNGPIRCQNDPLRDELNFAGSHSCLVRPQVVHVRRRPCGRGLGSSVLGLDIDVDRDKGYSALEEKLL